MKILIYFLLILTPTMSYSTTHVFILHGSTIYFGSDGKSTFDDGKQSISRCKPEPVGAFLLFLYGRTGDVARTSLDPNVPLHVIDFHQDSYDILISEKGGQDAYDKLVARAKDNLKRQIDFHIERNRPLSTEKTTLGGILLYFDKGLPIMRKFYIKVLSQSPVTLENTENGSPIVLVRDRVYQFPTDTLAGASPALAAKIHALALSDPRRMVRIALMGTAVGFKDVVGPPYATGTFDTNGVHWDSISLLCTQTMKKYSDSYSSRSNSSFPDK